MGASGSVMKLQDQHSHCQKQNPEDHEDVKFFIVSLSKQCAGYIRLKQLPPRLYLKISTESLDFLDIDTKLALLNFPFQHILCWGSSPTTFKFTVEERAVGREEKEQRNEGVDVNDCVSVQENVTRMYTYKIVVKTPQGDLIEKVVMKAVRTLMAVMEKSVVRPTDFAKLKCLLIVDGALEKDWMVMLKVVLDFFFLTFDADKDVYDSSI